MKRSEIEGAIQWARAQLRAHDIRLPMFGEWTLDEWRQNRDRLETIVATMRGWDVTDFNTDDFAHAGAVLFTIRNGLLNHPEVGCPYAEKLILMKQGQTLPLHYHVCKTEDIINRAGSDLKIQVYNSLPDGAVDREGDVPVHMDGIDYVVKAGAFLRIRPGNSLTIRPCLYHKFLADEGSVVVGEVSSVNDDNTDNYFAEKQPRFSRIEEDVPATVPLCNEYRALLFG